MTPIIARWRWRVLTWPALNAIHYAVDVRRSRIAATANAQTRFSVSPSIQPARVPESAGL